VPSGLAAILERAQGMGLLGPAPIREQLAHALALAELIETPTGPFLDLGAGAGVPGLVLAAQWPEAEGVLLDAGARRGDHLRQAVAELELEPRVTVVVDRAETAARDPRMREHFDLVVARAFGGPAATAECAVGFLRAGGRLVVSEPPGGRPGRWDPAGLEQLGLDGPALAAGGGATAATFGLRDRPSGRWPRRTGVPQRRPLWG
jgi:16S rRNA (guanine527-N7)-methyltransferase